MYKIESYASWFIVDTKTKREAWKEGVIEFGRGYIKNIERASQEDIDYFISLKGKDAIVPLEPKDRKGKHHDKERR